jgi:hypothetical protein
LHRHDSSDTQLRDPFVLVFRQATDRGDTNDIAVPAEQEPDLSILD